MDFKLLAFNKGNGSVLVERSTGERLAIDVPIQDGEYITGHDLLAYIQGLVVVHTRDVGAVTNHADIAAMCLYPEIETIQPTYRELRARAYPPVADFLDAYIKDEPHLMQEYIDKCWAVKARYPKPPENDVSADVLRQRRELT